MSNNGLSLTKAEGLLIAAALENMVRLLNEDTHLSANQRKATKDQAATILAKLERALMPPSVLILPRQ